jgi:hypothetical protein
VKGFEDDRSNQRWWYKYDKKQEIINSKSKRSSEFDEKRGFEVDK